MTAYAKGGDVFVLDMGESVKIADLARTMVRLFGKKLEEDTGNPNDIRIEVTGLRNGEKLYEELFISEGSMATEVSKISTLKEVWVEWLQLQARLLRLQQLVKNQDADAIKALLKELAFIGERGSVEVQPNGAISIETNKADSKHPSMQRA